MKISFRWYGDKFDTISLKQIKQIPGIKGIITSLMGKQAGEIWTYDEIKNMLHLAKKGNLNIYGIESVNVSDDIKIGTKDRDQHIENYIKTLENLALNNIKLVCYNFMPVFDWTRSELARTRKDGSSVLAYNQETVNQIDPKNLRDSVAKMSNGHIMPGWEPERLNDIEILFEKYKEVSSEKLFDNLIYFLKAIGPVCEKYDIKMCIHPDDPAWPIFGLPRIITNKQQIMRILNTINKPYNGLTFCTGSLGTNPKNDLCDIIKSCKGKIPFAHIRNLKHNFPGDFEESSHISSDGSFDMFEIMKTLYDTGFDGIIRPDHGRMIWNEKAMPGYGLYDRALGATYLQGLWEAINKS